MKVGRHDLVASGQSRAMQYRKVSFFAGGPGLSVSQRVKDLSPCCDLDLDNRNPN